MTFSEINFVFLSVGLCAYLLMVYASNKHWGRGPFLATGIAGTSLILLSTQILFQPAVAGTLFVAGITIRGYAIGARLNDAGMSKLNALWAFFPYIWLALLVPEPEDDVSETAQENLLVKP